MSLSSITEEDWLIWRILTHPRMNVGLQEMEEFWTFDDLLEAHRILNEIDNAEERAIREMKNGST